MSKHNIIFGQILQLVPRYEFEKAVKQHNGDFALKGFICWEQFVSMMFAQLSGQTGLIGIETTLDSIKNLLYHIGVKKLSALHFPMRITIDHLKYTKMYSMACCPRF